MVASLKPLANSLSSVPPGSLAAVVNTDKAIRKARNIAYPIYILYIIAGFIALVSLSHFASLGYRYASRKRASRAQVRTSISLFRLPTALVDSLRALVFRWTVPVYWSFTLSLAEFGLALGYIGVLFLWTFMNTTSLSGVPVEPRYYANRSGRIAASQFTILTALGMRNNFISWLTGISFEKLNYLHRLVARVLCILLWVHGAGHFILGVTDDLGERYLQCGILATSALTLLAILTFRPVRQKYYETFKSAHFTFVFLFMIGTYYHLADIDMGYYGAWPMMVIWGFERFIRLVRLMVYNFAHFNPFGSKPTLDATIDVLSEQVLRVTTHRPSHFHWRPGQSAFLSFPSVSWFPFQSHPFTIATIDEPDGTSFDEKKLVFLFRVRDGFTKKLMRVASPEKAYKIFINGPYSSPPMLVGYDTVILIAGGSGVTFTLPLFLDLIRRANGDERLCRKVIFMWAIRSAEHIRWIEDILSPALVGIPQSMSVVVKLYLTKSEEDSEKWANDNSNSNSNEKLDTSDSSHAQPIAKILDSPLVSFENGRPDLQNIIQNEIASASGRMSINACGPHGMAKAVRKAIRVPRPVDILRGGPSVTLHVESFGL